MPPNDFKDRLDAALGLGPAESPYVQAVESIRSVVQSIEQWLNQGTTGGNLQVRVEPGFPATIGQQLNVVVRIPGQQVNDTLFRVYVDPAGKISLDLYGEAPVPCTDEADLQQKILDFLGRPENKSRMNLYKELTA